MRYHDIGEGRYTMFRRPFCLACIVIATTLNFRGKKNSVNWE
jgi:hypothetical protein